MRNKTLESLKKQELIDLITDIYIEYQMQCDDPTEYEIMTEYLKKIISTDHKYNKENLELIIQDSICE